MRANVRASLAGLLYTLPSHTYHVTEPGGSACSSAGLLYKYRAQSASAHPYASLWDRGWGGVDWTGVGGMVCCVARVAWKGVEWSGVEWCGV